MNIITADFETYYDKEYSLSKLTTEQYVRDPRFEVILFAVKQNNGPTEVITSKFGEAIKQYDWENSAVIAHNAAFDGAILTWRYGIKPKFWFDTLSMSRPFHGLDVGGSLKKLAEHYQIGEKGTEVVKALGKSRRAFTPDELAAYGEYCRQDVELTWKLFKIFKKRLPVSELIVIDQLIRMFTEPVVELDSERLDAHLEKTRAQKQALLDKLAHATGVGDTAGLQKLLSSNQKFADLLRLVKVEPPMKISPTTGKETYAFAKTDPGFLELQRHDNPLVQAMVTARLGTKSTIEETRTENLIAVAGRGRLPIMLNFYGAHTGRLSGGDKLNLQNLPARQGKAIRQALCAPEGHKFIVSDLSQIEARIAAWSAGQRDLVEAFREGRDVYCEFASEVYDRTITRDDKKERTLGKVGILSLQYGVGADKFRHMATVGYGVKIDEEEAKRIVGIYRKKYTKIPEKWHILQAMLRNLATQEDPGLELPNGLKIRYPKLEQTDDGYAYKGRGNKAVKLYGGKMFENHVQALAALAMREQMAVVGARYKIAFQVHDEIIVCVPDEQVDEAYEFITTTMSTPPKWAPDLPVACEAEIGDNYADAK